jgi:uncharacterized protein (UPF0333 family)
MNRVLFLLIVVSFLGIGSCKKKATDPDYCGSAWVTQVSAQVTALSVASQAYATDQSPANCNAYKTAYQNYLDALKPFANCATWTAQEKSDLQDEIAQAEQDISTLCQ